MLLVTEDFEAVSAAVDGLQQEIQCQDCRAAAYANDDGAYIEAGGLLAAGVAEQPAVTAKLDECHVDRGGGLNRRPLWRPWSTCHGCDGFCMLFSMAEVGRGIKIR